MRVCRVGAGGELCQMLFGNLEGWRLSVFYYRYCARLPISWMSCVSVERCFLNPCCASWRMLCLSIV